MSRSVMIRATLAGVLTGSGLILPTGAEAAPFTAPAAHLDHYSYKLSSYKARHFDVRSCTFDNDVEPVSARFVVRNSAGRIVRSTVTEDFWYTNNSCGPENNGTIWDAPWYWDARNRKGVRVPDGIYRTTATVKWSNGSMARRATSNVVKDRRAAVTRYRHRYVLDLGTGTSDRWCVKQRYGNCIFSAYGGDLLITATFAKGYASYRLIRSRRARVVDRGVDWVIGTRGKVTWRHPRPRVYEAVIKANGFNGQKQAYIDAVWLYVKIPHKVVKWSIVKGPASHRTSASYLSDRTGDSRAHR